MKKSGKLLRTMVLVMTMAFCLGLFAPTAAWAAGDALSTENIKNLLNSEELHPQPTGYSEMDALLAQILAPYQNSDTYTKIKVLYDWTVKNIDYSWEGYSKTTAPAYDCFTLTYDLTYDSTLKEAIPKEVINRSYHALTARKGVCYDWGALFAVMARYVGIEAYVHTGNFIFESGYGRGSGHHGWTELSLGGKNYIFDGQREYRLTGNGQKPIQYLYFGIPYGNAWRYTQETAANAKRDAGFLPVGADRTRYIKVDAVASRSGSVEGGGSYAVNSAVTLTNASEIPLEGWYNAGGRLLSTEDFYTFTAERDTTVYALYAGDYFCDVPAGAWYLRDVSEAVERQIVSGVTPVHFRADDKLNRAMAVVLLANADGAVWSGADYPFKDVAPNAYYAGAVSWAWDNGIVGGISADKFAPSGNVTREQLAVMIIRYLEKEGMALLNSELSYADSGKISAYAVDYLEKAQSIGLVGGYEDGTLKPKGTVTRAEGVTMLMRALHCLEDFDSSFEEESAA
ncbi:MAG: S-layer homology domain-containing protein [Bacillota bacterium]